MSFYREVIFPHLCDRVMRNKLFRPYRERVTRRAEGRVLEIGVGSGLNLPLYGSGVTEVVALEPDGRLSAMAKRKAAKAHRPVSFLRASAETIPLDDASVDSVVTTWTLCSIPDAYGALHEIRRVLKPNGRLHFVEHGLAPETGVQKWQNRLTPMWKKVGGGCHLNRSIAAMIEGGGFKLDQLDTGYVPGPRFAGFLYEGSARPR
ncbi:MAG: methyltransferase domain-containing protein [Alphaproteobacteria bacterium]|nr:methyltransferase domain-containing protein [Alphaproteobacteria bacterium]MDE2111893.1 methyltransferase domain-containing protein [Alphaproteobacteria bacterium]MDE2492296.1 methyltransferase domain-containing protein [Alphaproteobacteria bacterium]